MFHVGQKVECINDYGQADFGGDFVRAGERYVVQSTYTAHGSLGLLLAGMLRRDPTWGDGWAATRFRPVVERKTDISTLTALLNTTKISENA